MFNYHFKAFVSAFTDLEYKQNGLFKRAFNKKNSEHMPAQTPARGAERSYYNLF